MLACLFDSVATVSTKKSADPQFEKTLVFIPMQCPRKYTTVASQIMLIISSCLHLCTDPAFAIPMVDQYAWHLLQARYTDSGVLTSQYWHRGPRLVTNLDEVLDKNVQHLKQRTWVCPVDYNDRFYAWEVHQILRVPVRPHTRLQTPH